MELLDRAPAEQRRFRRMEWRDREIWQRGEEIYDPRNQLCLDEHDRRRIAFQSERNWSGRRIGRPA
jgi:hypothetical protein